MVISHGKTESISGHLYYEACNNDKLKRLFSNISEPLPLEADNMSKLVRTQASRLSLISLGDKSASWIDGSIRIVVMCVRRV